MSDYIRREDAIDALDRIFDNVPMELTTEILRLRRELRALPSSDVEEVVRCRDCNHVWSMKHPDWQEPVYICTHFRSRWNHDMDLEVNPDDFCSYGERKE